MKNQIALALKENYTFTAPAVCIDITFGQLWDMGFYEIESTLKHYKERADSVEKSAFYKANIERSLHEYKELKNKVELLEYVVDVKSLAVEFEEKAKINELKKEKIREALLKKELEELEMKSSKELLEMLDSL